MALEFHIRYTSEGWLDIVEERNGKAAPQLCPDLVITSALNPNPAASLN